MAAKSWKFTTTDGTPMEINLRRNTWVSVNGRDEINAKTIKNKEDSNIFEAVFDIPLPNGEIVKMFSSTTKKHMVYNGRDVETGEAYEVAPIPAWAWVFVVLYVANFFLFLGGALGAVVNLFGAAFTIEVATRSKKSTGVKVVLNILILIAVVVISLLVAILISGLLA